MLGRHTRLMFMGTAFPPRMRTCHTCSSADAPSHEKPVLS